MEQPIEKPVIDLISPAIERGVAERSLELPMLPRVVTEVLALVNDPDSHMGQLAKLIESDPALAAHVMRVANSPAFAGAVKMSSLQQASSRLGMENIAQMTLAISMSPSMFSTPDFDEFISEIWRSSLAEALWAKELARLRRQNVEVAYLSGMLAQIGKPAVLSECLKEAEQLKLSLSAEDIDQLIERYHPAVAALLTDLWHLPLVSKIITTLYSLAETESGGELAQSVVENVAAAKRFAAMMLENSEMDRALLIEDPIVVSLALYPEDVEQLLLKTEVIRNAIEALMI